MDAQQQIDFVRSQQLSLLRDCELPTDARDKLGAGVRATVLKAVLSAIDQYARGRPGGCYASVATLAKSANVGLRTATRAVEVLESLGLICVSHDGTRRGQRGALTNRYTIVWSELALLVDRGLFVGSSKRHHGALKQTDQSAMVTDQSAMVTDQSAMVTDQSAMVTDQSAMVAHKACIKRFETSTTNRAPPADWEVVVVELIRLEVMNANVAVDRARANGLDPADALAIVQYYTAKPKAWGPGALHYRLSHAIRGQSPADGWPKPSEECLLAEQRADASAQREAAAARTEAARSEMREVQAAKQRELDRAAWLEAEFGAVLDGMSQDDRDNFVDATLGRDRGMYRSSPQLARELLLEALAKDVEGRKFCRGCAPVAVLLAIPPMESDE